MNKIIFPLKRGMQGDTISDLQKALDSLGYTILLFERTPQTFYDYTEKAVRDFQQKYGLQVTGIVDEITANKLNELLGEAPIFTVEGTVISRERAGVGGLRVEIVDKNVGGDISLVETVTDQDGAYRAAFSAQDLREGGKVQPDLQARVFADEIFLAVSPVRYDALNRETLDVLVGEKAAASLQSEYETLTGNLLSHVDGNLGDLKETDDQQDITYLSNKTGWDARAVALAALADQFSQKTVNAAGADAVIEPSLFYALFRSGLPANEDALYQTDGETVMGVWKQAVEKGIIPKSHEGKLPEALEHFQGLASRHVLEGPASIGLSPLKEMLALSIGDNAQEQQKFAEIHTRFKNNLPKFWEEVRGAFGVEKEKRLRLDGQLAYLTLNNAPLIRKLHALGGQNGLSNALDLVGLGFYHADKWREAIGNDSVPKEIKGASDGERQQRYAEVQAAQIRLSYPTAVVAQMVKDGETPLLNGAVDPVHGFLMQHQGKFEIGMQPVEQYLKKNHINLEPDVAREITRIQRVYQITPGDDAMNVLLKKGIDSASTVVRYGKESFIDALKDEVGGEENAKLIYAKAQQVHTTVLNVVLNYLTAKTAPGIGGHSDPKFLNPEPTGPDTTDDVIAYPTLEGLFGEMDYCECEHCRSVLSPAAYMVDLLQFIDPVPGTFEGDNPLDVLLSRRPDLQHIPLTCENTNTPLPYIDLVNEALEHYITNNLSLADYRGHNTTDEVKPTELLANPQFVSDRAYEVLAGKPENPGDPSPLLPPVPHLPFHRPLENLRRYFNKFEAPLPKVMEALRENDELERATEDGYGWRDIWMEEVLLSRAEYARLTDRTISLMQVYGFPAATPDSDVLAELSNAKSFTRRIDISYIELVEILKTRFVNPQSTLIPRLERLGISFARIKAYKDGIITDLQIEEALSPHLDESKYGGDIKAWLKDDTNFNSIMSLITLTNPAVKLIRKLVDSGIPIATLKALKDGDITDALFDALVPSNLDVSFFGGDVNEWVRGNLDSAGDDCSFDKLEFRHADPNKLNQPIRGFKFIQLIRFIRLWKKLDWTIEQTDKAITVLYPSNQIPDDPDDGINLQRLDDGFLTLLPRLGVLKRVMELLKLKPRRDLLPLLACFAPIDTHGANALYREMFLSPALLELDGAFADDGYGNFLTDETQKLLTHTEALRAAFLLPDDELTEISSSLDYDGDTTLTLENISAIFRRGWLARKLKLSVREFLMLTSLTDIDPFGAPDMGRHPDPVNPAILRLIELSQLFRTASVKPHEVLYLVWNQDISGQSAPQDSEILAFASTVRDGLAGVDSEFALSDDPQGEITRERMTQVYGSQTTDLFFGLLDKTVVTEISYDHGEAKLDDSIIDTASGHIAYDDFRKILSWSGVFGATTRAALKVGVPADFESAIDELYVENQSAIVPFFYSYPELEPLHDAYVFFGDLTSTISYDHNEDELAVEIMDSAQGRITYDKDRTEITFKGVLSEEIRDALKSVAGVTTEFRNAIDDLFDANQISIQDFFDEHSTFGLEEQKAFQEANDVIERRRSILLENFSPELKRRQKRQHALQIMSDEVKSDILFANAILENADVLHAAGDNSKPALVDITDVEGHGLSTEIFFSDSIPDPKPDEADYSSDSETNLAYSSGGNNTLQLNPAATSDPVSGIWSGYIQAPENGNYNFYIEADPGAAVALNIGGETIPLDQDGNVWSNTTAIEFIAGRLYKFALTVEKVKDKLNIRWQTFGQGRVNPSARYLYSAGVIDRLRQGYVRFLKTVAMADALEFRHDEMFWFGSHSSYRINGQGWLNSLPIIGSPNPAVSTLLFKAFVGLLHFARIKADLSPGDGRLLNVLQDPERNNENAESELLLLTRWNADSLDTLLTEFGAITGDGRADRSALKELDMFHRIYDAMSWIRKLGISASALIKTTTNEPDGTTIRDLQSALRARYSETDWFNILQPINDELRSLQRNALVAYILHQMRSNPDSAHIDTAEKLFEYFLMDVKMEPCMMTSRIRHALSSIQLFIERCLMNLEFDVSPSAINAKQWEWRNRYRVWEANRKVFLWPENWLEPELRDDQSSFFKETMSELLQSDITEERAAVALLNYLQKLDEVGKLEPCGMHYIEKNPGANDDIAHVVARTAGANRKYYYRRKEGGSWTPWEQIKLDIEDNPVIPAIWRGRLLLFWLRILKESKLEQPDLPSGGLEDVSPSEMVDPNSGKITVKAILCWSEYFNQKWQPTRTSDIANPLMLLSDIDPNTFDRSKLKLSVLEWSNGGLRVIVSNQRGIGSSFFLYNVHSIPENRTKKQRHFEPKRSFDTEEKAFSVTYANHDHTILNNNLSDKAIDANHPIKGNPWDTAFFYEDRRHVFWVSTAKRLVTVPNWEPYIPVVIPQQPEIFIPPLVFESLKKFPQEIIPLTKAPGFGVVDPVPVEQVISEDAYITKGIGSMGTVKFGDKEIGLTGSQLNLTRKR